MDVYGSGDYVTEVGKTTIKDEKGNVTTTGKYMAIWEKRNGKWVCIRDINNEDAKEKVDQITFNYFAVLTSLLHIESTVQVCDASDVDSNSNSLAQKKYILHRYILTRLCSEGSF